MSIIYLGAVTNSSTSIYSLAQASQTDALYDAIDKILQYGKSDKRARDLFDAFVHVGNSDRIEDAIYTVNHSYGEEFEGREEFLTLLHLWRNGYRTHDLERQFIDWMKRHMKEDDYFIDEPDSEYASEVSWVILDKATGEQIQEFDVFNYLTEAVEV